MATYFRAPLRAFSALTAVAVMAGGLFAASPAYADTAPAAGVVDTVSTDPLPTVQIDGIVYSQVVVGNTVYVAGRFTNARPAGAAAGVNTTPRANVLAYDVTTGALKTAFVADTNAQVNSITATPDGSRIFIGGTFTSVNGVTRYRVAALDPNTGAVVPNFAPSFNGAVDAVKATATTLYAGGNFTAVGSNARTRGAAVAVSNGALQPFAPVIEGGRARGIAVSPDGGKVVYAGSFTTVNGSDNPGYGMGAMDTATGASLPWNGNAKVRNGGADSAIYSLTSDSDSVYGTGYHFGAGGNLETAFRMDWANGDVVWVADCHGDTYSGAVHDGVFYTAGHSHYCSNVGGFPQTDPWTFQRGLAFSKSWNGNVNGGVTLGYASWEGTPAPDMLNWWPDFNTGTVSGSNQGPWSVAAGGDYVVYGGEFTRVNNKPQQGLVRFATKDVAPNDDGPRLSAANFVPALRSVAAGVVRATWLTNYDRDNQYLTYRLIRDGDRANPVYETTAGSRIWFDRPTLSFTDRGLEPGSTHTYQLRAEDPFGNVAWGDPVSVTVSADGSLSDYAASVLDDGATNYWRLSDPSGTTITDWAGLDNAIAGTGVALGQSGAITGDADAAALFNGTSTGRVYGQTLQNGPTTFTLEAWFKTSSRTGGKVVGFGSAKSGNSGSYDRHIYLDGSGRIYFGVYPGSTQTLSTGTGFNDGQWHHVAASLSSAGMELFVDGARAGRRTDVTTAQSYTGYWRMGGDNTWTGAQNLTGTIDDVAVYSAPLTLAQVREHYTLSGRSLGGPAAPTDNYGAAIYAGQPDTYWRLSDASASTTAADYSGNNVSGVYNGGVTKPVTGVGADAAASFDGVDDAVVSSRSTTDPRSYSLELMFKTDTTRGGKLIGFGNAQTGLSSSYDRHVYMQDDGRLVFGTYTNVTNTVTTEKSYNDNQWHQVVATQSSAGMRLYVDGVLVGSSTNTGAQAYTGYWRIGGDTTWGSSSAYFRGTLDEAAVYSYALPAETVAAHYAQTGIAPIPNRAPSASFTATATDLKVAFDAAASSDEDGTVAQYAWDFGDSTTGTGVTAEHAYTSGGTYTVTLTVTDDDGATAQTTRSVTVVAPNVAPQASFTSSATGLRVALDASASADSDGTVASYAWSFGDGTTGTGRTADHTYATAGTYTVTLTVTDDRGATAESTGTVTVSRLNDAPTASFTASAKDLTVDVDAAASADSDGTIASYAWSWGDGSGNGSGRTASHDYAKAGTYTVTLEVTDDAGATASTSRSVTVTDPPAAPSAPFAADSFERSATGGFGSADTGGTWTVLGGASSFTVSGGTGNIATPAGGTRYAALGGPSSANTDAQVAVSVTRPAAGSSYLGLAGRVVGASSAYFAQARVSSTGAVVLALVAQASVTSSTQLRTVTVPGLSVATGDSLQIRVQALGTSPTTVNAKVWKTGTAEPADWQVTATDTTGALQTPGGVGLMTYLSGSAGATVTSRFDSLVAGAPGFQTPAPPVNLPPTAAFTAAASDLTVAVDGRGSADPDGSIASHSWNWGDGSAPDSGATATHTYATAGSYTVTLTVTDDKGATATTTRTVQVTAPPVQNAAPTASFTATGSGLGLTVDASASADSDGTIASYAWNFGDGTTAIGPTASHTYATGGTYAVTLTVTDDDGAPATVRKDVTVTAPQPQPEPAVVLAKDGFERTASGSLGSADTGGAWTLLGGNSSFSVSGGTANIVTPAGGSRYAALTSVSSTSTDLQVTATAVAPVSGTQYIGAMGRVVGASAAYRSQVRVASTGEVTLLLIAMPTTTTSVTLRQLVVPGLTAAAGDQLRIRFQVTGTSPTTLKAKVWKVGTTEPADWQATATDNSPQLQTAGGIGLFSYLSASANPASITARFDDIVATPAQ